MGEEDKELSNEIENSEIVNNSSNEKEEQYQKIEITEDYKNSQDKDLSKTYKPKTPSQIKIKIVAILGIIFSVIFTYGLLKGTDNKKQEKKPSIEKNVDLNKMENQKNDDQIAFPKTYEKRINKTETIKFENIKNDKEYENSSFLLKKETVNPLKIEYYSSLFQEELNARKSEIGFKQTFEKAKEEFKQVFDKVNEDTKNFLNYQQTNVPFAEPDINKQLEKKNFFKNEEQQKIYNKGREIYSLSPYEVKAGTFIPGALISGVNSDLPGNMKGIVRENVYDTVTGNHLLIPKGTTLIGTYDSNITFGQNRALVIWQRLIFPNGKTILLDNMGGVDLSGYAGFKDKVDNHNLELFKAVILSSILGAGTAIVTDDDDNDDWKSEAGRGAGEQMITIGNRLADKLLSLQPTITIKPGYRFNIMLHSDLILTPYEDLYERNF